MITGIFDGMGLKYVTELELAKDEEVWKATEEVVWALLEWKF
jgi:hypothetical protein